MKKIMKILILIAFVGHISLWAMEEKTQPVSIPNIIATKSVYIKNLKADIPDINLTEVMLPFPGVTQDMINDLASLYKEKTFYKSNGEVWYTTNKMIHKDSFNELDIDYSLNLVNLAAFFDLDTYAIQSALIEKILQTKLEALDKPLSKLTEDQNKDLMRIMVVNKTIGSKILEPYSNFLAKTSTTILEQLYNWPRKYLLFYNDKIKVYKEKDFFGFFIQIKDKPANQFILSDEVNKLLQDKDITNNTTVDVNEDSSFCILTINFNINIKQLQKQNPAKYNMYDNKTKDLENQGFCVFIKDKQLYEEEYRKKVTLVCKIDPYEQIDLIEENINTICFKNKDTLYVIDHQGQIKEFNLINKQMATNVSYTLPLQQNLWIASASCRNNALFILSKADSYITENRIFYCKENSIQEIPTEYSPKGNPIYKVTFNPKNIIPNNAATQLLMINITPRHDPNTLFLYDILSKRWSEITSDISSISINPHWISQDALCIVPTFTDINVLVPYYASPHYGYNELPYINWPLNINVSDNIKTIADDGKSCIFTQKTSQTHYTTQQVSLYNDIMLSALDYFNPDKEYKKTSQQRLLGTILLYHIVNKQQATKKPVELDATEAQIYYKCLPVGIHQILKDCNFTPVPGISSLQQTTIESAPQQQSILSIVRNYTSYAYNSLQKKLSEYKFDLLFNGISAVAIVAAYRYLTSK
jgi:hypothetical protein